MVVLDADSVMTGSTLVELVRTMEANPSIGLIQTVPIPARRDTLFGRLGQFAACIYSPMLATGQSFWQTDAANYWGHNAIIRVGPFVEHCTLPVLPGNPPLGGPVLSHDFVEAALMRRAAGVSTCCRPSVAVMKKCLPTSWTTPNATDAGPRQPAASATVADPWPAPVEPTAFLAGGAGLRRVIAVAADAAGQYGPYRAALRSALRLFLAAIYCFQVGRVPRRRRARSSRCWA